MKIALALGVVALAGAYCAQRRRAGPVAAVPVPAEPVVAESTPVAVSPAPVAAEVNEAPPKPQQDPPPRRVTANSARAERVQRAPDPPLPVRVVTAVPVVAREPAQTPAPVLPPPSARRIAEQLQPDASRTPLPALPALNFVSYTARFLVVNGARMRSYATFPVGKQSALYTHGVAFGKQTEEFKNAVYVGFGTQWGGGAETLQRYELSWQFAWAPLGTEGLFNPHIGFRLGGMMAASDGLTGGSMKPGIVAAPQVGLDVQAGRHVALTAALSYDANLGPDVGPDATLSGYSYELGAAVRF